MVGSRLLKTNGLLGRFSTLGFSVVLMVVVVVVVVVVVGLVVVTSNPSYGFDLFF